jgi:hypothetical protein
MKALTVMKTLGILTFLTAMPALTSIANIGIESAAIAQEYERGSSRRAYWCENRLDNLRAEMASLRERRERRVYQGRPTYEIDSRIERVRDERRDLRERCNSFRDVNWR